MDTTQRVLRILGVDGDTVDVAHLARKYALSPADIEAVVAAHGPSRSTVEVLLFDRLPRASV